MLAFERRLLAWSSSNLGLSQLGGPTWASFLLDGDFQSLHRDSPNGQVAFSFGLVRGARPPFRGGETLLARPELLDYWRRGAHRGDRADTPLFDEIAPRFNRLVLFDARVPHAVRMVEGPRDPRDGRLALQGWIRAAGCVAGEGIDAGALTEAVNEGLARVPKAALAGVEGLHTLRFEVSRGGRAARIESVFDLLVGTSLRREPTAAAARALTSALARVRLPAPVLGSARVLAPVLVEANARARVPSPRRLVSSSSRSPRGRRA
jgi:hypothetical protein